MKTRIYAAPAVKGLIVCTTNVLPTCIRHYGHVSFSRISRTDKEQTASICVHQCSFPVLSLSCKYASCSLIIRRNDRKLLFLDNGLYYADGKNKRESVPSSTLILQSQFILIFRPLKLCLATATHNFKWLKISHICSIEHKYFQILMHRHTFHSQ